MNWLSALAALARVLAAIFDMARESQARGAGRAEAVPKAASGNLLSDLKLCALMRLLLPLLANRLPEYRWHRLRSRSIGSTDTAFRLVRSAHREYGFLCFPLVEQPKCRLGVVESETVCCKPLKVDLLCFDQTRNLIVFVDSEVPGTHEHQLFANKLVTWLNGCFAGFSHECDTAERHCRVQSHILGGLIAGTINGCAEA